MDSTSSCEEVSGRRDQSFSGPLHRVLLPDSMCGTEQGRTYPSEWRGCKRNSPYDGVNLQIK